MHILSKVEFNTICFWIETEILILAYHLLEVNDFSQSQFFSHKMEDNSTSATDFRKGLENI